MSFFKPDENFEEVSKAVYDEFCRSRNVNRDKMAMITGEPKGIVESVWTIEDKFFINKAFLNEKKS